MILSIIDMILITRSPKCLESKSEAGPLTVEVASSFRPAVSSRSDEQQSLFVFHKFFNWFSSRIGMARMDTVDLSSGSEVYTPDVEEVNRPVCFLSNIHLVYFHTVEFFPGDQSKEEDTVPVIRPFLFSTTSHEKGGKPNTV